MPTYDRTRGTWKAMCCVQSIRKQVFLGRFESKERAVEVEREFRSKHPTGKRRTPDRIYKDLGLPRDDKGRWIGGK